jgi:hypothetical protein
MVQPHRSNGKKKQLRTRPKTCEIGSTSAKSDSSRRPILKKPPVDPSPEIATPGKREPTFERTPFTTSRLLDFFTEKELNMQIGQLPHLWPLALVKELIDNSLDACENAGCSPVVRVKVEPDAVSISDNGPGLPSGVLVRSLDYNVRVSDKSHYVSPSRGQLGNALKCVWAAPFVADGTCGHVEVVTLGERHVVDLTLNRITQKPDLQHQQFPSDGLVQIGTKLQMCWPEIASLLDCSKGFDLYNANLRLLDLLLAYDAFNPPRHL